MPIPTTPKLTDVIDEFGATNQPDALRACASRVLGTAITSLRDDWDGLGKPSISGFTATTSSTDGGYLDLDFTVTRNGLDCVVIVQYQENNGSAPDPGSWLDDGTTETYSTDGAKVIDYQVPETNQSYHVRLQYYNEFNDQASSDYLTTAHDTATSSDVATLTTPDLSAATLEYATTEGYMSFTYNDDEDDFDVEVRVDGSSSTLGATYCDKNVGTGNNPKEISFEFNDIPSSTVEYRVKATSTTLNDSAFSSWESATSVPSVPGCPL